MRRQTRQRKMLWMKRSVTKNLTHLRTWLNGWKKRSSITDKKDGKEVKLSRKKTSSHIPHQDRVYQGHPQTHNWKNWHTGLPDCLTTDHILWQCSETRNERDECGIQSTAWKEGREGIKKLVKYIRSRLVSSMGSIKWNELKKQLAKEEKTRYWTWKRQKAEQVTRSRNGLKNDY
jgi:hypothetical protein